MLDLASPSPQGLIELAWPTLLHSVWLGLLAGALASMTEAFGRPATPAARHAAIVALLIAVAIAAPAAAVAQWLSRQTQVTPASFRTLTRGVAPAFAATSPDAASEPVAAPRSEPADGRGARIRALIAAASALLDAARPWLLAAWAVGASAFAGALVVGTARVRRLKREAIHNPTLKRRARALGRALRLRRTLQAREHPDVAEPCLAGAWRPMALAPSRWLATASAAEVDAVLAHELAHAKRLDHLANLLLRGVEAAFWFHPGVRRACRIGRREAERAADALAARLTGDPLALARALESVARSLPSRPRTLRAGLAVGGDRSALLPRIQELLGMKPARPRFPLRALVALPLAAALAVAAVATASNFLAAAPAAPPSPAPSFDVLAQGNPLYEPIPPGDDPAKAEWLARVHRVRAKIANPESDDYAMSVLFRLVPGRPRSERPGQAPARLPETAPESLSEETVIRLASTRPARLSRDDLVTLVRTIPHGLGDSAKLSREELLRIADPDQVSVDVRFLQNDRAWPLKEAAGPAQVVPAIQLWNFASYLARGVVQAPKVTTFEGAWSLVSMTDAPVGDAPLMERLRTAGDRGGADARLVARLDGPIPAAGEVRGLVVADRLGGGLLVRTTAIRKPWGHAVEIRCVGTLPAEAKTPNAERRTVERLARLNVPDGFGVVLDAGIDVLGADDDPSSPPLRTLVAVTPIHILNEEEEKAVNGPVDGFATTPTASR